MLALLCSPSNEALHSSTATRLICLAGLRVHHLFKVTLKRPSAIVRGSDSKPYWRLRRRGPSNGEQEVSVTRHCDNLWRSAISHNPTGTWQLFCMQSRSIILFSNYFTAWLSIRHTQVDLPWFLCPQTESKLESVAVAPQGAAAIRSSPSFLKAAVSTFSIRSWDQPTVLKVSLEYVIALL